MHPTLVPPRRVDIGDAAALLGSTPRAIHRYHEIGLLPEPERSGDDRRRYGYEDMVRLLWIHRMAEAGTAPDDIRDALTSGPASVDRRMGLLPDIVTERLRGLPEGSLRPDDLDTLLVTERIFGPLGAAVQTARFVVLATHPTLREESDRIDDAEKALDDSVAVDDPRVAQVAAERHAFESALNAVIDQSGPDRDDDALFDAWDVLYPPAADEGADHGSGRREPGSMSALEAVGKMPYDFSPARLRCLELTAELAAQDPPAT